MKRSGIPACDVPNKAEAGVISVLFAGIPLRFIPAYILPSLHVTRSEAVITGDNDLLVLHPWQGIQILNPAQALQLIE